MMLTYLTFFILKLMGIKKGFSQDPIDYIKLRKSDKKEPSKRFSKKFIVDNKQCYNTKIITIKRTKTSDVKKGLIIFVPGGAFISGPAEHHWKAIEKIASKTDKEIWLLDYPKAPEHTIQSICKNIDEVYKLALRVTTSENITFIGDSVGANLILTLVQRQLKKGNKTPSKLILITPVFDASLTNINIDKINKKDPMLDKIGVLSAKKMCADTINLKNPIISPLYGNFKGFPSTVLFIGGKDIMFPDGLLAVAKMKKANIKLQLISKPKMPHIFPLLPIMPEAKKALQQIIDIIK